jgi:hypothetical protein
MMGKPEVTTFIGLRYNLVLLIATSKHLMCKCNNVVAIKSAVTPNAANAPYDYCSSLIITVFSVIPQEDFASNATSNICWNLPTGRVASGRWEFHAYSVF